ncbi:MAG: sugar ABC transporter substrate-binding protein [Eubacteriales bacterium]|nr:sugar ABC transporter substrate-binding protein [Eubacteriales bacterium]
MGRKKKENMLVSAGGVVLLLILAGCLFLLYFSRNKNRQEESQKKIGAVYMTMNNPYFEVIDEKIKAVVRSRGDVMVARDSAMDAEMQNRQIKKLIEEKVDILLINAVDWKKIREGLEAAKMADIPVLAVDAEVYDTSLVEGTVVSDNYAAGELCALDLMKKREGGKILFLIQKPNKSAVDRVRGFKDTLDKAGWPYETVGELDCQGQLEVAQPMVEKVLEERRDIDVVMGLNDPSSLGAMAALDAVGMLPEVLVYSVDGAPESKTMIYEGRMTATAAQSPTQMGTVTAELLYKKLAGESVPEKTTIPVELITGENIGEYSLGEWE